MYLIDFGMSTSIADTKKYKFRGTPFFASNSSLKKLGLSPRDDIESLLYILIFFTFGDLPWKRDIPVLKEDV